MERKKEKKKEQQNKVSRMEVEKMIYIWSK
jgi:hypothetical protein